jgi:hypothetical protein
MRFKRAASVMLCVAFVFGCASTVVLKTSRYNPALNSEDFSEYSGKSVFISSFVNNDNSTTNYVFSSRDKTVKFRTDDVAEFLKDCFVKNFNAIGVTTQEEGRSFGSFWVPHNKVKVTVTKTKVGDTDDEGMKIKSPKGMPALKIAFYEICNSELSFKAEVYRDGIIAAQKHFTVTTSPVTQHSESAYEGQVGELITKAFRAMVTDQQFKKALTTK